MGLFNHQKKLLELNPDKWLLAWGTGSGKTRTAIELALKRFGHRLVICPKSLVENWKQEINKWGGKDLGFVVMSKERFKKQVKTDINWCSFTTIIVDEAHYFSNYKSGMTKALYEYINKHRPENIYLLTATPYLSSPWNIYSLANILGRSWNWYKFKKKFFYDIKMGRRTIPVIRKGIESDISRLVNNLGSTVKLEDCADVPSQVFLHEYFELTKDQKKEIEGLNDVLPIVRINKIQQLEGGFCKGDMYVADKEVKSEKLDRIMEYVSDHKKIAIICRFTLEIDNIVKKLKEKYPSRNIYKLTGKSSGEERHSIIEKIHKDDDTIIVIQAQLCEGYSLETVPVMVFYSMDYSLKAYLQMLGRVQRVSNIKKNVYVFFITKGGVGEAVYDCVVNKKMDFNDAIYAEK